MSETFEITTIGESIASLELVNAVKNIQKLTDFDFDGISAAVDKRVNEYKNSIYSGTQEEQYQAKKKDRATINKAIDTVKAKNISMKKEFYANYDNLNMKMMGLVEKLMTAQAELDRQAKEYEQEQKDLKQKAIKEYYAQVNRDIEEDFKEEFFQKIYDATWLNVSTSAKTYKDALTNKTLEYINNRNVIKEMHSEYEEEGLSILRNTLTLSTALSTMEKRRQEKEAILAKERERLEREAREKIASEQREKERIEAESRKVSEPIGVSPQMSEIPVQMTLEETLRQQEEPILFKQTSQVQASKQEIPKVLIEIQGGMIIGVMGNCNIDVTIVDHDVDSPEEINEKRLYAGDCDITLN